VPQQWAYLATLHVSDVRDGQKEDIIKMAD